MYAYNVWDILTTLMFNVAPFLNLYCRENLYY